jgi:hypothetical protein
MGIIRVNKSRRIRWVRHIACIRKMRNLYKILVKKSEGNKRPLRRPWCRWEDYIKIDVR